MFLNMMKFLMVMKAMIMIMMMIMVLMIIFVGRGTGGGYQNDIKMSVPSSGDMQVGGAMDWGNMGSGGGNSQPGRGWMESPVGCMGDWGNMGSGGGNSQPGRGWMESPVGCMGGTPSAMAQMKMDYSDG